MGEAWLKWRLQTLSIVSEAARIREEESRKKLAELEVSMESGREELRVGKERLKVRCSILSHPQHSD